MSSQNNEKNLQFKQLQEEAKNDLNIVGFFLSGSRGKGFETKHSDYDIYIIVKDSEVFAYKKKYPRDLYEGMDLLVQSLSEFRELASWGSPSWWARYSFAHIKVLIDKNGEIQKLVDKKSKIPEKHLREFIRGSLDGYINYVFRSMKCLRAGDVLAARLEAAYSIPLFFDVIFAIHHRRLRPYYKYLRWELQTFPLIKLHLDAEELINSISKILDNADLEPQQNLLKLVETALRSEGYGDVFDSWGSDLTWMKTYRSSKNFERGFFTGESKIE